MSRMITEIRFNGYRLLDDFKADLGDLTVIIGANATGKSSLLDALSLVSHSMGHSIEDVLSRRGGMYSILSRNRQCAEIEWSIKFQKPREHQFWSKMLIREDIPLVYEARVGSDRYRRVEVLKECLRNSGPLTGHTDPFKMLELDQRGARVFSATSKRLESFNQPAIIPAQEGGSDTSAPAIRPELPDQKAALLLSQMRFENEFPSQTWVRAYLANFFFYTGFDVGADSPVRAKPPEIRAHTVLNSAGDNLGTVLHEVLTRHDFRPTADALHEYLRAAYPYFEAISAETTYSGEPRVLVRIRETGMSQLTEVWEFSDGMLRFLLLCMALLNPLAPALIAVDEPETGLHPRLLPIVADVIKSAAARTQVIITTHSPALLNCFELKDIAVITRDGPRARWFRPDTRSSLKAMLDSHLGGSLGDLHMSGELEALA